MPTKPPEIVVYEISNRRVPEPELAQILGRVTIAWTDVQSGVFDIFAAVSEIPRSRAEAIFFALRTDMAQRDITLAAAKDALQKNAVLLKKVSDILGEISDASGDRNAASHAMWAMHYPSGHLTPNPFVRMPKKLQRDEYDKQFIALQKTLRRLYGRTIPLPDEIHAHFASLDRRRKQTDQHAKSQGNGPQ
jgi:hypothetical protein